MTIDTEKSSFREKLIEHLLIGDLLKYSWLHREAELEIARPDVDNSGFDVIAEDNGVIRHIQLKASFVESQTSRQKVHTKLVSKPSGCVVWVRFDRLTMELDSFLFFGDAPGKRLPSLERKPLAKHTKGNKSGHKGTRKNIKIVNKGDFRVIDTIPELYEALFGPV